MTAPKVHTRLPLSLLDIFASERAHFPRHRIHIAGISADHPGVISQFPRIKVEVGRLHHSSSSSSSPMICTSVVVVCSCSERSTHCPSSCAACLWVSLIAESSALSNAHSTTVLPLAAILGC